LDIAIGTPDEQEKEASRKKKRRGAKLGRKKGSKTEGANLLQGQVCPYLGVKKVWKI